MNRTVYTDVDGEQIAVIADQIKERYKDSLLILAPVTGKMTTYAPTKTGKNKGYHRLKVEVWIPEEAIEGDSALTDFGITALMRLPKNRVKDEFKKK